MILKNYTPHPIHLIHPDGVVSTFESLGEARASEVVVEKRTLQLRPLPLEEIVRRVPLARKRYGQVTGLPDPDPTPGTMLIVSTLIQQACPGRSDLISPDQVVRDDKGRIIGCRGFYQL